MSEGDVQPAAAVEPDTHIEEVEPVPGSPTPQDMMVEKLSGMPQDEADKSIKFSTDSHKSTGERPSLSFRQSSARSPAPRMQSSSTMGYDELLSSMTGSVSAQSADLNPDTLKRDVGLLSKRLNTMGKGLLNPRSKMMQYWDFATLSALLFTATVTPYEVCLMWEEQKFWNIVEKGGLPLFIINGIINLIFVVDMGFNFFLPYKESVKNGGGTIKNHRLIARHYLCGWFPLDLMSVLPIDAVMMGLDTSKIKNASIFSMIRMLRLLRLIKVRQRFVWLCVWL